MAHDPLER